jgi:hypothetical protein
MPWIPLYLSGADYQQVIDIFNCDPDVCFVVGNGDGAWRAVDEISVAGEETYTIWHTPSGPFRSLSPSRNLFLVEEKSADWIAKSVRGNPKQPMIWAGGQPGVIHLELKGCTADEGAPIALSGLQWVGNKTNIQRGMPTSECTEVWWNALRRGLKKQATVVPYGGLNGIGRRDVYAFPQAIAEMQAGRGAHSGGR